MEGSGPEGQNCPINDLFAGHVRRTGPEDLTNQETSMKQQRTQRSGSTSKLTAGRMATAIVALGGLSGLILADGTAGAASGVVVSTTNNAKLGKILVDGKTVYTLRPSSTPCTSACLAIWPALTLPQGVNKATAGKGVKASKLGTVAMSGGTRQVTYGGKRLYFFSGDTAAGQVHGNVSDTWGKWSAVVTAKPATTSSGSGSGGNSGGSTAGSGGASF
jgi:predicted lipoprotein with Yx(FWY)xxD motif